MDRLAGWHARRLDLQCIGIDNLLVRRCLNAFVVIEESRQGCIASKTTATSAAARTATMQTLAASHVWMGS